MTQVNFQKGPSRSIRRMKGYTLIEFGFVAMLIILGVIGTVALLKDPQNVNDSKQMLTEISSLRGGVKAVNAGTAGYGTGSMNANLVTAEKVPGTLVASGSTITNEWNGAVVVTGATSTATISYASVPKSVCISGVAAGGGSSWTGISVNGTAMTLPSSFASATTACNASSNTIVWTFS